MNRAHAASYSHPGQAPECDVTAAATLLVPQFRSVFGVLITPLPLAAGTAAAQQQQQPQFVHAQQPPQTQVGLPPHYPSAAGTDMRSPPVMSPNQNAQLPPSQQQLVTGRVPQQPPPHMVPQHPTLMGEFFRQEVFLAYKLQE